MIRGPHQKSGSVTFTYSLVSSLVQKIKISARVEVSQLFVNNYYYYILTVCSTEVENCNVLVGLAQLQWSFISFFSFFDFLTFSTSSASSTSVLFWLLNCQKWRFSHIDGPQNARQLFNVIRNIRKCIVESTWVTKYAKLAKRGQNLRFHFLVEKWQSLGEFLRKKNRKS